MCKQICQIWQHKNTTEKGTRLQPCEGDWTNCRSHLILASSISLPAVAAEGNSTTLPICSSLLSSQLNSTDSYRIFLSLKDADWSSNIPTEWKHISCKVFTVALQDWDLRNPSLYSHSPFSDFFMCSIHTHHWTLHLLTYLNKVACDVTSCYVQPACQVW